MVKFIDLNGEYEFKWEYSYEETTARCGYGDDKSFTYHCTRFLIAKLKGVELIEWLQNYGLMPSEMFKGVDPFEGYYRDKIEATVENYKLFKTAEKWKEENQETVANNPWTCVGMNGGYVLMSNASKENTVELGSASAPANVKINNSTKVDYDPKIDVSCRASLI